ncbi:MAG: anaerobic ribonucleoside-triphosphate reductase activating protein [Lachnospiraceae bacterium]|jgi:anaerobic ribonucleoside-triphosphate reductase activating protein|nr:anaerobic ribonucleoside-triphosphate reductase activating protein [Lachnospiraceae bacterium]
MNYATVKYCDIANGEGVRVSLFVSGCTHHCRGCFNEEAWPFEYGEPFTGETEERLLDLLDHSYIAGLSLLGGEPFEPENQQGLVPFLYRVRERFPHKNVWCYTGYTFESDLLGQGGRKKPAGRRDPRSKLTDEMLSMTDILVDGEYREELRNISLQFRGSENQRIIDVKASLQSGHTILAERFMN